MTACIPGLFNDELERLACIKCAVGRSSSEVARETVCDACTIGRYQNSSAMTSCDACIPGTYQTATESKQCLYCQAGRASSVVARGTICTNCTKGRYQQNTAATSCLSCIPGTYMAEIGKTSCSICAVGRQSSTTAREERCNDCVTGKYQSETGTTACLNCIPGRYQPSKEAADCIDCEMGKSSAKVGRKDGCDICTLGRYQANAAATNCLNCIPGKFQNDTLQTSCINCEINFFTGTTEQHVCTKCFAGRYTSRSGSASCTDCGAGSYGSGCKLCPIGWARAAGAPDLSRCTKCDGGETTDRVGSASCSSCDLGTSGNSDRTCSICDVGLYQDERKMIFCKKCEGGKIPNEKQTSCESPSWKVASDCSYMTQFLNDTATDKMLWDCLPCPKGGHCGGHVTISEIRALAGHWRIPWSEHNISFQRCPYRSDCLGVDPDTFNADDVNDTTVEGCKFGTKGPLCSLCIQDYNRDVNVCQVCVNEAMPLRITVLIFIVLVLGFLLRQCRKRIKNKWKKYKHLWRDFLRVVSINITYAQINSSLPSVIDIEWPAMWTDFVKYFSFVNIDIMALIGAKCIGDFDYYLSFIIMTLAPVSILIFTITNYHCSVSAMKHQLLSMTKEQKGAKYKEALHALFELTDADHSGHVDPAELAVILRSLGYAKIKFKAAIVLAERVGAHIDDLGHLILTENQFVDAMISGKITRQLDKMRIGKAAKGRSKSFSGKSKAEKIKRTKSRANKLMSNDELVKWTLKTSIVSDNLSGATQLLLLAHTPVSRKVFQYFYCNNMAGIELMRADYDIDCNSAEYFRFMYFVGVVMIGFVALLPGIISFYLFRHWNDLYSTKTNQRIGWLYEPFVRGAEFWQVHDLMMKMVLTGMLIYVPPTSRAGVAIIICVICCCNLNFFEPHKNKIIFWLSQVSFITTTFKYTTGLLLTSTTDKQDMKYVGYLLIFLDIFFIFSSFLCILIAICMIHVSVKKIKKLEEKNKKNRINSVTNKNESESLGNYFEDKLEKRSTKITPILQKASKRQLYQGAAQLIREGRSFTTTKKQLFVAATEEDDFDIPEQDVIAKNHIDENMFDDMDFFEMSALLADSDDEQDEPPVKQEDGIVAEQDVRERMEDPTEEEVVERQPTEWF